VVYGEYDVYDRVGHIDESNDSNGYDNGNNISAKYYQICKVRNCNIVEGCRLRLVNLVLMILIMEKTEE
jgi:hypothetical protein